MPNQTQALTEPDGRESALPKVSIVVTCLNSGATIAECVRSVTSQNYPNTQVILVDGGSTDDTKAQALRAAGNAQNFRLVIDETALTPARGRNKGAKIADGEFLAFTDSDCIAEPDWVTALAAPENWKTQVVAVGGKTVFTAIPRDESLLGALHGALGTRLGSGGSVEFFDRPESANARSLPACNVMYSSEIFKSLGGFDESLRFCEDSCLSARARRSGFRLVYTPKAVIHHRYRDSVRQFSRWMFDYGKGRGVAMKKDRGAITLPTILLILSPVVIFGLAILQALPWDRLLFSALGIYLVVVLASALNVTRKKITEMFLYATSYPIIHLSYAAGLAEGLVSR